MAYLISTRNSPLDCQQQQNFRNSLSIESPLMQLAMMVTHDIFWGTSQNQFQRSLYEFAFKNNRYESQLQRTIFIQAASFVLVTSFQLLSSIPKDALFSFHTFQTIENLDKWALKNLSPIKHSQISQLTDILLLCLGHKSSEYSEHMDTYWTLCNIADSL